LTRHDHCLTADRRDVFHGWLDARRDRKARIAIQRWLDRVERDGHFGDRKGIEGRDLELRIVLGPGNRVCCSQDGDAVVLLLVGGDKSTQSRDIGKAI